MSTRKAFIRWSCIVCGWFIITTILSFFIEGKTYQTIQVIKEGEYPPITQVSSVHHIGDMNYLICYSDSNKPSDIISLSKADYSSGSRVGVVLDSSSQNISDCEPKGIYNGSFSLPRCIRGKYNRMVSNHCYSHNVEYIVHIYNRELTPSIYNYKREPVSSVGLNEIATIVLAILQDMVIVPLGLAFAVFMAIANLPKILG